MSKQLGSEINHDEQELDIDGHHDNSAYSDDVASFEIDFITDKVTSAKCQNRSKYQVKRKIELQLEKRRFKKHTESLYDDWD